MTIVEFLTARLDEQEAWLRNDYMSIDGCQECGFAQQPASPYSKAGLLADIDSKRALIEEYKAWADGPGPRYDDEDVAVRRLMVVLKMLASTFADHPDYQREWGGLAPEPECDCGLTATPGMTKHLHTCTWGQWHLLIEPGLLPG